MDRIDRQDETAELLVSQTEADRGRTDAPDEGTGARADGPEEPVPVGAPSREADVEVGVAAPQEEMSADAEAGDAEVEAGDAEAEAGDAEVEAGDAEVEGGDPPKVSRKIRRRSRRVRPRSRTIAMKRLTREELRVGALLNPPVDVPRPQTRAECQAEARPCPWVACKHHLYLDINPDTGSIKINFPDLEPWELKETCALDIADRQGITLEEVGDIMNLTRERIRQVEVRGLLKIKMSSSSPDSLGDGLPSDD